MALSEGPTPAPEAIERADEVIGLGITDRQAQALALLQLAPLYAMSRDFDRARDLVARAIDLLQELGVTVLGARTSDSSARVELMAGDLEAAERKLRADYDALTAMDERYYRPNITALLAKTLYDRGKHEEAEEFAKIAAELASDDDVEALAMLRSVQARLLASRGHVDEARELALEVAEQTRETDAPVFRADTLADLAEALESSPGEQAAALEEARRLYAQKQHLVGVARVVSELERLIGQAERTAT